MEWDQSKIENKLASAVITSAMKIHTRFGPGLLESAYRECLAYELRKSGHNVQTEKTIPLIYETIRINHGYRIDLLVNDKLVVELKSVEAFTDVHFAQVMTYLKLGDYRLGLLINFKVAHLKDGLRRVVNHL
jgi:GxxExxY protein